MLKNLFRPGKLTQWQIPEKETIDEIIFRTTKARNHLMLELMARGDMRVAEIAQGRQKVQHEDILIPRSITRSSSWHLPLEFVQIDFQSPGVGIGEIDPFLAGRGRGG